MVLLATQSLRGNISRGLHATDQFQQRSRPHQLHRLLCGKRDRIARKSCRRDQLRAGCSTIDSHAVRFSHGLDRNGLLPPLALNQRSPAFLAQNQIDSTIRAATERFFDTISLPVRFSEQIF